MLLTDSLKLDLLGLGIAFVAISLAWHKWKLGYWKRKGVPGPQPLLFLGNAKDVVMGRKTLGETYKDVYLDLKPKGVRHAGVYFFGAANYLALDLELIKRVLQIDFPHFHSHGVFYNEKVDPLSANILNLDGQRWKDTRSKLTPTFTSGKIKMMHQIMVECSNMLEELLEECANRNPVDIKDITARFTTDIIGSCAFGIEINSMKNPNAEFRVYGSKILEASLSTVLRTLPPLALPHGFLRAINYRTTREDVTDFFHHMVTANIEYREKNNVVRKDFLNLLMELKNNEDSPADNSTSGLTVNEIAAQSLIFFLAGFETSSTTINFASYELATNREIQEKVRDEINQVLSKYDGELTYEAVMEMDYLDKVVLETLRKYPPLQFLFRSCTKDYMVEKEKVLIDEGIYVMIPVLGIHYDPVYYPDPEKFDPERFNEENKKKRPPYAYLPFGEGPRICIGLRFGLLQTKMGLITLLRNFKMTLNTKTKTPISFSKTSMISASEGGMWLNLQKISTNL